MAVYNANGDAIIHYPHAGPWCVLCPEDDTPEGRLVEALRKRSRFISVTQAREILKETGAP